MAKYIVDIDSLVKCLDYLYEGKVNGHSYAFIENIKGFIAGFPMQKIEETLIVKTETTITPID